MPRNRSLPAHLERRPSGYYWRRRRPRLTRSRAVNPLEDKFLCFSLRTHVLRDAKILARRLTGLSDQIFAALTEKTMPIAPETTDTLLTGLARFEIDAFERSRALAGPRCPKVAALDLQREAALQETLRQAIYLGNRDVAREPLRHIAEQLDIELNETDQDWTALAYEATKVLLDVSVERERRQQGRYDQPTVFFRRALNSGQASEDQSRPVVPAISAEPATFALAATAPKAVSSDMASFATTVTGTPEDTPTIAPQPGPDVRIEAAVSVHASTCDNSEQKASQGPVIVPAGLDLPAGYDEESWQRARIAARPPRILIDRRLLSQKSRAALEKQRGITLVEAIELYFDLLRVGYKAPFNVHQKLKPTVNKKGSKKRQDGLCEDHSGKRRMALDYWPAVIGDEPVDEISIDELNDALQGFWNVPANHGKSSIDRREFNLLELIEKAVNRPEPVQHLRVDER